MKERPILFGAPMVRAILAGTKTQTRRVVKPSVKGCTVGVYTSDGDGFIQPINVQDDGDPWEDIPCPFGQPGDRLWVRETWAAVHFSIDPETGFADDWHGSHDIPPGDGGGYWSKLYAADNHPTEKEERGFSWRPSIHMPRWASRITLEVTGVRVERLCDISEEDASAEGVIYWALDKWSSVGEFHHLCVDQFRELWSSINGAGSWDANPWVWVVEFRRL